MKKALTKELANYSKKNLNLGKLNTNNLISIFGKCAEIYEHQQELKFQLEERRLEYELEEKRLDTDIYKNRMTYENELRKLEFNEKNLNTIYKIIENNELNFKERLIMLYKPVESLMSSLLKEEDQGMFESKSKLLQLLLNNITKASDENSSYILSLLEKN